MGNIGLKFPFGFNLYAVGGKRHFSAPNIETGKMWLIKGGYIFKPLAVGETAVALDYGHFRDLFAAQKNVIINGVVENEKYHARSMGATLVQNIDALSTKAYVAYRRYHLSTNSVTTNATGTNRVRPNYAPVSSVMVGAQVTF